MQCRNSLHRDCAQVALSLQGCHILFCIVAMAATITDLSILSLRLVAYNNGIEYSNAGSEIYEWLYESQSSIAIKSPRVTKWTRTILNLCNIRGEGSHNSFVLLA